MSTNTLLKEMKALMDGTRRPEQFDLPTSGTISMGDINVELGRSRTLALNLRWAADQFGLPSGTVRMSDFYGRRYWTHTITNGTTSVPPAYGYSAPLGMGGLNPATIGGYPCVSSYYNPQTNQVIIGLDNNAPTSARIEMGIGTGSSGTERFNHTYDISAASLRFYTIDGATTNAPALISFYQTQQGNRSCSYAYFASFEAQEARESLEEFQRYQTFNSTEEAIVAYHTKWEVNQEQRPDLYPESD